MRDALYFDTRPQSVGLFAQPVGCEDYGLWVQGKYGESNQTVPWGVAQKVHAAINAAKQNSTEIVAIGPGAGKLAALIEAISNNSVEVKVI